MANKHPSPLWKYQVKTYFFLLEIVYVARFLVIACLSVITIHFRLLVALVLKVSFNFSYYFPPTKGVVFGGVIGLIGAGYIILGTQNAILNNLVRFPTKPLSTHGCDYYFNSTLVQVQNTIPKSYVFPLYKLSYTWYTALGALITILSAVLISLATDGIRNARFVDRRTISPIVKFWFRKPTKDELLKVHEMELVSMLKQ